MKKKILIVSDIPIFPNDEGNRNRVYNIIENMKKLGVDVYFLFIQGNRRVDINKMKEYIGNDKIFFYKSKKIISFKYLYKKILRKLLRMTNLAKKIIIHYDIDEIYPKSLSNYVENLQKEYNFNIIWVEYVWYSKLLEKIDDNILKIIDTHDIFTNREDVYLKNNEDPSFLYTTKRQESKGLSRANCIIAIQNKESEFFREIVSNSTEIITIGNSIEADLPCVVKNKKYLFVGSGNKLNVYSMKYFIENILPIIKKQEPNSELLIVGGVCNFIPDSKEYIKLGYVKDLKQIYRDARLVINPIQSGTGLNIKTIEALGHSKPLITTTCGAKGLIEADNSYIIADDNEEFAKRVVEILNDDLKAEELSKNAYKFINDYNIDVKEKIQKIIE